MWRSPCNMPVYLSHLWYKCDADPVACHEGQFISHICDTNVTLTLYHAMKDSSSLTSVIQMWRWPCTMPWRTVHLSHLWYKCDADPVPCHEGQFISHICDTNVTLTLNHAMKDSLSLTSVIQMWRWPCSMPWRTVHLSHLWYKCDADPVPCHEGQFISHICDTNVTLTL